MPRKTKELENENDITKSKVEEKKETTTKPATSKKSVAKKTNIAKSILEKATSKAKAVIQKEISKKETVKKLAEPKTNTKKNSAKKVAESKTNTKKNSAKEVIEPKASAKKNNAKEIVGQKPKANTKKRNSKETTSKPANATSNATKTTATKKTDAPKKATKKIATKPKSTASKTKVTAKTSSKAKAPLSATKKVTTVHSLKVYSPEYYDLPFKYNKTVVTILAQTPTNLFIYWEISDEDRQNLKNQYGEYFFEITKPVLIVHNITKNYAFEIDIDDFANSWYINVDDSDCEYKIELGRRPIAVNYSYMPQYDVEKNGPIQPISNPYIYISSSNNLISPNDHVLFDWSDEIYFKNVKTNEVIAKQIKDLSFIDRYGKIVNLYELYQKQYGDDFIKGPSFWNPSSMEIGSKFR